MRGGGGELGRWMGWAGGMDGVDKEEGGVGLMNGGGVIVRI